MLICVIMPEDKKPRFCFVTIFLQRAYNLFSRPYFKQRLSITYTPFVTQ